MWGRGTRSVYLAASLLALPGACQSEVFDRDPATGGTSSGGATSSAGGLWSGVAGSFDLDPTVDPNGPQELVHGACTSADGSSIFDQCVDLPCPEGIDCSSGGGGGASNGGAAGAAGQAGAPTDLEPLPTDLCPLEFPPITSSHPGCALLRACVDPPTASNGHLTCCYRVTNYHCL